MISNIIGVGEIVKLSKRKIQIIIGLLEFKYGRANIPMADESRNVTAGTLSLLNKPLII